MKIPLLYSNGRIVANTLFSSQKYRLTYRTILFVVDTGSSETFLGYGDALRLGLPINQMGFVKHIIMGLRDMN